MSLPQPNKKIAVVLRYHVWGFSYRRIDDQSKPRRGQVIMNSEFHFLMLPLELFYGNTEYL